MVLRRSRRGEGREDKEEGGLRAWLKDALVAVLIVLVFFASLFVYTRVWPPLVVIESSSMQHSDTSSSVGVIDTGDLVLVQATPARSDVVTWVEGRVSGHSTYGDYGDVIVFRKPGFLTTDPVIHRAILFIEPNGTDAYDVKDLEAFPSSEWEGRGRSWEPKETPFGLRDVTIRGMGWRRDLVITFNLTRLALQPITAREAGYITMGDNNAYATYNYNPPVSTGYDQGWVVPQENILGRARGELPWFGLLKLTLAPTDACCRGWGDPQAPLNSWDSLLASLVILLALPFVVEGVGWAWTRFVRPRIRRTPDGGESGEEAGDTEGEVR